MFRFGLLGPTALTIRHGGLNTVLESQAVGVPLVANPIANKMPGAGARLAVTGGPSVVG